MPEMPECPYCDRPYLFVRRSGQRNEVTITHKPDCQISDDEAKALGAKAIVAGLIIQGGSK